MVKDRGRSQITGALQVMIKEFGFYSEGDGGEFEQKSHMVGVAFIGWRRVKS